MKYILLFLIGLLPCYEVQAQVASGLKSITKSVLKKGAAQSISKEISEKAAREIGKNVAVKASEKMGYEASQEIGEQYVKRMMRQNFMEKLQENGYKNFSEYYKDQAIKRIPTDFKKVYITPNEAIRTVNFRKRIRSNHTNPGVKSVSKKRVVIKVVKGGVPGDMPNREQVEEAIDKLCQKNPFFEKKNFEFRKMADGYEVIYTGNLSANANTGFFMRNDEVIVATSAKVGYGQGKNGTNEFLMDLLPNQNYVIDGSIRMRTDAMGRITNVESNVTQLSRGKHPNAPRNPDVQKQKGRDIAGDDYEGGHLVSHSSGGPDELEVPMLKQLNHNKKWRELEDLEAKKARGGKQVYSKFEVIYDGDSQTPSKIIKTSIIDGKKRTLICDNKTGEVTETLE